MFVPSEVQGFSKIEVPIPDSTIVLPDTPTQILVGARDFLSDRRNWTWLEMSDGYERYCAVAGINHVGFFDGMRDTDEAIKRVARALPGNTNNGKVWSKVGIYNDLAGRKTVLRAFQRAIQGRAPTRLESLRDRANLVKAPFYLAVALVRDMARAFLN